jgi:membrane fusion protein
MTSLFRKESVDHATRRLHGDVTIAIPASVSLSLCLLIVVIGAAVTFASLASYARKETVAGWLVPSQGLVRAAPREAGSVAEILVEEGDVVQAGAPLARLVVTTTTAQGDVGAAVSASLEAEAEAVNRSTDASVALLQTEAAALRLNIAQYQDERAELERQLELEFAQSEIAA